MKILSIFADRCTDCRLCELACSYRKEGVFNPERSAIRVLSYPSFGLSLPIVCQQCEEAPCISVCPTKALIKELESGIVKIKHKLCLACKLCILACPLGAINVSPIDGSIIKCDLCEGDPACVRLCPQEAIKLTDERHYSVLKMKELAEKCLIPRGSFHGK
ncbi:MAG: 4Fe-4S dicluster domain-containing protein [Candidatus Bathyarchaeia archaeon]